MRVLSPLSRHSMDHQENRVEPTLATTVRHLPIEFTGSGSEYFRIWIVNLLLLVVTLGLYWPWAKVRRLRYFWGNTLVDGDPLGFHGNPRQMFKGWMLVGVLFGLYNWASNFSAVAGVVAFLVLAGLWPALWRSSMMFRMANTSWRGLRFRFTGSLQDAYAVFLPLLLSVLPFVLLVQFSPDRHKGAAPPSWVVGAALVMTVVVVGALPWLLWRMKAYQHRHYAIGELQTDFRAPVKSFYALAAKPLLVVVGLVGVGALLVWAFISSSTDTRAALVPLLRWMPVVLLLCWGLLMFGLSPWFTTRLQNLVWTKTGNSRMRFVSELSFPRMFWLSTKNGVLIALTLGLYWPFAAIAKARLRLDAVHIRSVTDLQALLAVDIGGPQEAVGDAAGDFFGMDVGL